jgi:hypothetical protein
VCVDANDNELSYLEAIHFFVEVLDAFFGNVCELDLVFNFYKVSALRGYTEENSSVDFDRCTPSWTKCFWPGKSKKQAKTLC